MKLRIKHKTLAGCCGFLIATATLPPQFWYCVAATSDQTNNLATIRAKLQALRDRAGLATPPAPKTNLLFSWSAQTNDVVIYSTTNLAIKFPDGWRNDGIFPPGQTNVIMPITILPIAERQRFYIITGYDPVTGLMNK